MVINIGGHFDAIMQYESNLDRLSLTQKSAEYFIENPDECKQRIGQLNELKKEIVYSELTSYYKDSFLESIDKYLGMLKTENKNSTNWQDALLYMAVGAGLAFLLRHLFDKGLEYCGEKYSKGFIKGFEKEMMQK